MKQCTRLVVKATVAFKVDGKGRTITFKEGSEVWVTNTQVDQSARGVVNIARLNQAKGYDFTPSQVSEFFNTLEG